MLRITWVTCLGVAALAGCGGATGPDGAGEVRIAFRVAQDASPAAGGLDVAGSNGTLHLTDISLIVDQVELESEDDACEHAAAPSQGEDDHAECGEFEAPPRFVRLALDQPTVVVSQDVPPGTYRKVTFEVKDLDDEDDERPASAADMAGLLATVRAAFPAWPREASMVVVGTFTPAGSADAVPFTAYFDAEIKIRKTLDPALVVADAGATVTIELDPAAWFRRADGTVRNLAAADFSLTGKLVELEVELRDGFPHAEGHH